MTMRVGELLKIFRPTDFQKQDHFFGLSMNELLLISNSFDLEKLWFLILCKLKHLTESSYNKNHFKYIKFHRLVVTNLFPL